MLSPAGETPWSGPSPSPQTDPVLSPHPPPPGEAAVGSREKLVARSCAKEGLPFCFPPVTTCVVLTAPLQGAGEASLQAVGDPKLGLKPQQNWLLDPETLSRLFFVVSALSSPRSTLEAGGSVPRPLPTHCHKHTQRAGRSPPQGRTTLLAGHAVPGLPPSPSPRVLRLGFQRLSQVLGPCTTQGACAPGSRAQRVPDSDGSQSAPRWRCVCHTGGNAPHPAQCTPLGSQSGWPRWAGQQRDGPVQLPGPAGDVGLRPQQARCGGRGTAGHTLSPQGRGPGPSRLLCCEYPQLPGTPDLLCRARGLISPTSAGSCQ